MCVRGSEGARSLLKSLCFSVRQALLEELQWSNKTVTSVASMDVSGACGVVYRDYNKLLRSVGDSAVQNAYLASPMGSWHLCGHAACGPAKDTVR